MYYLHMKYILFSLVIKVILYVNLKHYQSKKDVIHYFNNNKYIQYTLNTKPGYGHIDTHYKYLQDYLRNYKHWQYKKLLFSIWKSNTKFTDIATCIQKYHKLQMLNIFISQCINSGKNTDFVKKYLFNLRYKKEKNIYKLNDEFKYNYDVKIHDQVKICIKLDEGISIIKKCNQQSVSHHSKTKSSIIINNEHNDDQFHQQILFGSLQ